MPRKITVSTTAKYCPIAGELAPLTGSAVVAIDMPMPPPITSAASVGEAKVNCRAKPSARPIRTSLATLSIPASESSTGGAATGVHAQTSSAIAPVA